MRFWTRFAALVIVAALGACDSVPTEAEAPADALFKKPGGKPGGGGGGGETAVNPEIAFHLDGGLWVMNADGTNRAEILQNDCSHSESSWAPTGEGTAADPYRIINWGTFPSCGPGIVADVDTVGGSVHVGDVQTLHIAGSYWDTQVWGDPAYGNPEWSPGTGAEIALSASWLADPSTNEWNSAIYVIAVADLPSPTPELVYLPPPGCEVVNPTWNQTASEVAFREVCDPDGERILSVDRGSGAVSIVVPFGVFDGMGPIEWANTMDVLAVTALGPASRGKGEEYTVFSVDVPAGAPQFVGYGLGPTWAPDDSRVAFHYGSKRKIKRADASGGNETTLGSGELPAWRH